MEKCKWFCDKNDRHLHYIECINKEHSDMRWKVYFNTYTIKRTCDDLINFPCLELQAKFCPYCGKEIELLYLEMEG